MKKVIEKIGEEILDEVFDFNEHEYDFEGGGRDAYGYDPTYASLRFCKKMYGHDVYACVDSNGDVEVLFEENRHPNIEEAVQKYVKEHFDSTEFLSNVIDDVNECNEDEYQRNGFASARDYYNYRYSA